ncbi:MAG: type VI secretion system baseplate subunit TssG [Planctomycetes bacterium]|nr:type VI secretion system baseplate subunit TssG [Planctomycetota bacterium]
MRRIECANLDKPRIGEGLRASEEPVHLGQEPSLDFAPSSLARFEIRSSGPPRLIVRFLGLFGPHGALPLHLTEFARDRERNHDDPTFRAFADLFHHRMLSLFYAAWARSQPTVSFDRPDSDRISTYIASLIGVGRPSLRDRDELPDLVRLRFASQLIGHARGADGLITMIEEFFRIPAAVEEFVGYWAPIPEDSYSSLGTSRAACTLGTTAVLGTTFWDRSSKFRLRLGPLRLAAFERMLPGGGSLERLRALLRQYVGDELTWDVKLVLRKDSVPELRLGKSGRLAWTSWLPAESREADIEDTVFRPLEFLT